MSRFSAALLAGLMLWHIVASAPAALAAQDIDLIELTPSMEAQLREAKRLNGADPGTHFELNKLIDGGDGGPFVPRSASLPVDARPARESASSAAAGAAWRRAMLSPFALDLLSGGRRRASAPRGAHANLQLERSGERAPWTPPIETLHTQPRQAREGRLPEGSLAEWIRGLWLPPLPRYWWGFVDRGPREKRHRCQWDPVIGVKNPSFCDTQDFIGAADYGNTDVWGQAG